MGKSRNLTGFYIGLAVVAVVGGAFIVSRTGGPDVTMVPAGTTAAFPGYSLGSESAAVEIIEYADFECPACATFAILTGEDVRRKLVATGRVRWVFRDFPLPIHSKAPLAHLAAACAGEQGKFWQVHDQLFFNQGTWVRERRADRLFESYAQAAGVNVEDYRTCLSEQRYMTRIAATKEAAVTQGVNSTPTFVVAGRLVTGAVSYATLLGLVEQAEAASR